MLRRFGYLVLLLAIFVGFSWAQQQYYPFPYLSKGRALVYPYFNARGNNLTFIRVVNADPKRTIVAKVRLHEGKNSKEIADFAVCLSPNDYFSFWIASGRLFGLNTDRAVLVKGEQVGVYADDDTAVVPEWKGPFVVPYYNELEDSDTLEGYVEIIGLFAVEGEVKDCAKLIDESREEENYKKYSGDIRSLMGEAYIFNLGSVYRTYAYKAVAFPGNGNPYPAIVAPAKGNKLPLLREVVGDMIWNGAVLYAFYNLAQFYESATALIVNFPMKAEMIDAGITEPFSKVEKLQDNRSYCVPVEMSMYDDEENAIRMFSPYSMLLCNEVNYVPILTDDNKDYRIFETDLVSYKGEVVIPKALLLDNTDFKMGWLRLNFVGTKVPFFIAMEVQEFLGKQFAHMIPANIEVY